MVRWSRSVGKTSTFAAVASLLSAACGRVGFEPAADAGSADASGPARFCAEATGRIPANALASMCMDFEDSALDPVANDTYFVPNRLFARGESTFTQLRIVTDAVATTRAFRYEPAATPSCASGCCYSDLFISFGELTFLDRAHLEYDLYLSASPAGAWIGGLFWGSLNFPYTESFVMPSLELQRWSHVTIDGAVGTNQPLTMTVDGQVRTNAAGMNNLSDGIEGAIGTFCWGDPGSGYIDNIMFWGR